MRTLLIGLAIVFVAHPALSQQQGPDTAASSASAAPAGSIFWGDYFERRTIPRFLMVYWLVACLPLAFAGLATSAWMLSSVDTSAGSDTQGPMAESSLAVASQASALRAEM